MRYLNPTDLMDFNPRSREGSDFGEVSKPHRLNGFQSTLPRRERLSKILVTPLLFYFNPRSREGSDHKPFLIDVLPTISIHAPAKGATTAPTHCNFNAIFQSTLPRRERLRIVQIFLPYNYFNPRSRKGSDV